MRGLDLRIISGANYNISMKKTIIGIETTCDDTGIGIWHKNAIVANEVISSLKQQQEYGGVVPEVAARAHEQNLLKAFDQALARAKLSAADITHIAVANEPGLPGCLHVGKVFSKTLNMLLDVPLINVNHLYSHIFSAEINHEKITYPALGLVVSGGHTAIYLVHSPSKIVLLDETLDDAIGEVYDKVGRLLGFSYPAGPKIDKMYNEQLAKKITFLKPATKHKAFSYSGIKTAVTNYLHQQKQKQLTVDVPAVASSFQYLIINDFIERVKHHLSANPNIQTIALGGGVSANSYLRKELQLLKRRVLLPEFEYTNDNGAMHAYYANKLLEEKEKH